MWYETNLSWEKKHSETKFYMRYAESSDGIHWDKKYTDCLQLKTGEKYIIVDNKKHMGIQFNLQTQDFYNFELDGSNNNILKKS